MDCILIHNGCNLNFEQTFAEANIKDKDQLLVVGIYLPDNSLRVGTTHFFKRYRDVKAEDSTWNVGQSKWDAIIVVPSRNLTIMGIGIFEAKPSTSFRLGWKYVIENESGIELHKSDVFEE